MTLPASPFRARPWSGRDFPGLLVGVALCLLVAAAAVGLQHLEARLFGRAWIEGLVLAILLGAAIRSSWTPPARWQGGIDFSARTLLEIAVVLLGASISGAALLSVGLPLLLGIGVVVILAILISYGLGRLLKLPHRMAMLVACGNAICGNSAIAAVAPVIGADGEDVSASIAFTAVFGVVVVLLLPLAGAAAHLSAIQYGALAGLTVYAVPQVLAAAAPAGTLAVQIGTLVKLVRVLMLGPVCLVLSLTSGRGSSGTGDPVNSPRPPLRLSRLVPWFILGFLAMIALRSLGLIPTVLQGPLALVTTVLTLVAMAGLGLNTDARAVARSGVKVATTVVLSLIVLTVIAFGLITLLGLK